MNVWQKQSVSEFDLIDVYFKQKTISRSDVILGIGDDAALLAISPGKLLVVTMDSLVEGIHFLKDTNPFDIGYKALAVNLSDLAAMGATPAWFTLALTLPQTNPEWLENFSAGLFELAKQYQIQLIGGDTTRGPLAITIQAYGFVPEQQALLRSGATVGDKIYVSGNLGDAGLGLMVAMGRSDLAEQDKELVLQRLNRPNVRVELGIKLRNYASGAIDISDGLLADLNHLLVASQVGALIYAECLPLSAALLNNLSLSEARKIALTAGDDYELCFTIPPEKEKLFLASLKEDSQCQLIGEIVEKSGIQLTGYSEELRHLGYQHFVTF